MLGDDLTEVKTVLLPHDERLAYDLSFFSEVSSSGSASGASSAAASGASSVAASGVSSTVASGASSATASATSSADSSSSADTEKTEPKLRRATRAKPKLDFE